MLSIFEINYLEDAVLKTILALSAACLLLFVIIAQAAPEANRIEISYEAPKNPEHSKIYDDLKKEYGRYHAENISLPNALNILGYGPPLRIDNGLGGYLEFLGLGRSFDTITTWSESVKCKV